MSYMSRLTNEISKPQETQQTRYVQGTNSMGICFVESRAKPAGMTSFL
jgi:hypothetical protein